MEMWEMRHLLKEFDGICGVSRGDVASPEEDASPAWVLG
jgi:hypothetical protein